MVMVVGGTHRDAERIGNLIQDFAANLQQLAHRKPDTVFHYKTGGGFELSFEALTGVSKLLVIEATLASSKGKPISSEITNAALVRAFGANDDYASHEIVYDNPQTPSEVMRIIPKQKLQP